MWNVFLVIDMFACGNCGLSGESHRLQYRPHIFSAGKTCEDGASVKESHVGPPLNVIR